MLQFPNENIHGMKKVEGLKTNDQSSVTRREYMDLEVRVKALEVLIAKAMKGKK